LKFSSKLISLGYPFEVIETCSWFYSVVDFRFTDKEWPRQWYLNRGGDLDMNVEEAWDMGRFGIWVDLGHG
jgi:hypothetical protein